MHDKHIKFAIPAPSETVFAFKRALLFSIRMAIQQAHRDGHIDVETSVNCLRALPMPEPTGVGVARFLPPGPLRTVAETVGCPAC
jgi:hypothetical protein